MCKKTITQYGLICITLTASELEHFLYVYLPYSFLVLWIFSLNPTTAWFLKKENVRQNLSTTALFDGAVSAVWMKEKQKEAEKVRLYITKLACVSWGSPVSFLAYRKSLTEFKHQTLQESVREKDGEGIYLLALSSLALNFDHNSTGT